MRRPDRWVPALPEIVKSLHPILTRFWRWLILLLLVWLPSAAKSAELSADIVVYGSTPAGITAAIQASRMGHSVVLIEPGQWIGGMMTGGLGASDKGVTWTVGGLAGEFFENIYRFYSAPEPWKLETREVYLPKHGQTHTEAMACQWYFEPHVARLTFDRMLGTAGIKPLTRERLNRQSGVHKDGSRITAITMESGLTVKGNYFIDATYEGDLMAASGADYFVGREANSQYGETLNGIQIKPIPRLSPYISDKDPSSGLLPRIAAKPPGNVGEASPYVQAYNFRLCLTSAPENRVPFPKPDHYNPLDYELLLRHILEKKELNPAKGYFTRVPMPNLKTDSNNTGVLSTDFIGGQFGWAEGSYADREKILQQHREYQQGFFWFLANDPRVPEAMRKEVGKWGLAKDEFTDNGNWPTQLYVREARRMVGDFVMTEKNFPRKFKDADGKMSSKAAPEPINDPVAIGSYALDSHYVQMFSDNGKLMVDGGFFTGVKPYPISYRVLLPKASQCSNLLVPVCISASHVAYGSLRMEAVFMELGQAAATAAGLALEKKMALQKLPYAELRQRLLADRAMLSDEKPASARQNELDPSDPSDGSP